MKELEKIIYESESRHFNIPDGSYRRSEQHNKASLKFAHDILELIDSSDSLEDAFYQVKSIILDILTD